MLCILSPFTDSYYNIASEEYLLSNQFSESIFYLYKNEPSIIIGINQNAFSEVKHEYVAENKIKVVRRRSGGGSVYHDLGNLNFGFIFEEKDKNIDYIFKEYTQPILDVLQALGVNALFSGRNDLTINDLKFSGNAQYHTMNKVLIHGTLLFNSDLLALSKSLNASPLKFVDKSVKSVHSRVTNIKPFLKNDLTIDEFSDRILKEIQKLFSCRFYTYSQSDIEAIKDLVDQKYGTWEWNFGNSPKFTYNHNFKYSGGTVQIGIIVSSGTIETLKIYGDFFGKISDLSNLENSFKGISYNKSSVEKCLKNICISNYISNFSNDEFCREIFNIDNLY